MFPNLLPGVPNIRSLCYVYIYLPEHKLIGDNPQRKIVRLEAMIQTADDLRRHIPRRPTRLITVLFLPLPSNPKIRNPDVAGVFEDEVLRFDVAVDYAVLVDVLEGEGDTGDYELWVTGWGTGLLLGKGLFGAEVVAQVAASQVVQH